MLKRMTLFLLILSSTIVAEKVNISEALKVANRFLGQSGVISQQDIPFNQIIQNKINVIKSSEGEALAFVFNIQPKGFIIIAADNDIKPIIAYDFNSVLSDTTENEFLEFLKQEIAFRNQSRGFTDQDVILENKKLWQAYLGRTKAQNLNEVKQWPKTCTATGGWIETTWHQSYPYNQYCPRDPITKLRSLTGCVATGLSQILNYHKYVGSIKFSDNDKYVTDSNILIDSDSALYNFPSFEKINDVLQKVKQKYFNYKSITEEETAALNFAAGIALKTNYRSSASGVYLNQIFEALVNKFGYKAAFYDCQNNTFYDMLKSNIINALPVLLSIIPHNYTLSSHLIICDGYKTDGFYHLNFGWGEDSPSHILSAWYSLPEGMPAGYSFITHGVVDIIPGNVKTYLRPGYLDFGNVLIDKEKIKSFTVNNETNEVVEISSITGNEYFKLSLNGIDFTLSINNIFIEPNTSKTIYVKFVPHADGSISDYLELCYTDTTIHKNYLLVKGFGQTANSEITYNLTLSNGWNTVSLYTYLKEYSIEKLFAPVKSSSLVIKDGMGGVFWPAFNFNSIVKWDLTKAYQIYLKIDTLLNITGVPINPQTFPLSLKTGWNLVPYLYSASYPIEEMLSSINDELIIVKDNNGNVYWPNYNFNTIVNMLPCQGYYIYVDTITTLTYPLPSLTEFKSEYANHNLILSKASDYLASESSTILVKCNTFRDGDFITLRFPDGTFVGDGVIVDGRAMINYFIRDSISRSEQQIKLFYKCFNEITETELQIRSVTDIFKNSIIEHIPSLNKSLFVVDAQLKNDNPLLEINNFNLFQNYPNPFNSSTQITYTLSEDCDVTLKITNLLGQLLATIVNETQSAGRHYISLDCGGLASGIYFYTLHTNSYSKTLKLNVLK